MKAAWKLLAKTVSVTVQSAYIGCLPEGNLDREMEAFGVRGFYRMLIIAAGCALLTSCGQKDPALVHGYVEGEFVYVASPFSGQLQKLAVDRGSEVNAGGPLFELEDTPEKAARDQAARRVSQANATLEDAKQGQRPTELESIEAEIEKAEAALVLSQQQLERQEQLSRGGVVAQQDVDTALSQRDQSEKLVVQLKSNLATAQLGSREEQVKAAEENLKAEKAALEAAEWNLSQKTQTAPVTGRVNDVLYREGDWVAAGQPVVMLLPPANVRVRTFVSQETVGRIQPGDDATIAVDGVAQPYSGQISFISPRVEYTPPVIYSQEMRSKFVFMVELSCTPDVAAKLHPGQPVDVRFTLR